MTTPVLPSQWDHIIFEYWDVPEENTAAWMDYYVKYVVAPLAKCGGYGGTCLMLEPWMPWRADPHKVIFPHPQMMTRPVQKIVSDKPQSPIAAIRTNVSIDLHALLQHEWTHAVIHTMTETNMRLHWEWIENWEQLRPTWRDEHPGVESPADAIAAEFFTLVDNHWDVTFKTTGIFTTLTSETIQVDG